MSNPNSSDSTLFTVDDLTQADEIKKINFLNRSSDPDLLTSDDLNEAAEINKTFNFLNNSNDQVSASNHLSFLQNLGVTQMVALLANNEAMFHEQAADHHVAQFQVQFTDIDSDNHNNPLLLTGVNSHELSLNSEKNNIHPDLYLQITNEIAKYTNIYEKELDYEREEESELDKEIRDKIKESENKIIHSTKIIEKFNDKYTNTTTAYIQNKNNILEESRPQKNEKKRQAEKDDSNGLLENAKKQKRIRR